MICDTCAWNKSGVKLPYCAAHTDPHFCNNYYEWSEMIDELNDHIESDHIEDSEVIKKETEEKCGRCDTVKDIGDPCWSCGYRNDGGRQ